jgi:RNA polymerase sigma factor (sigma-70 family)
LISENHIRNILEGCRANERKSQKELYQLFYKYIFAACYRYHDNLQQVEKLTNDSFICLFKKLKLFARNQYPLDYLGLKAWVRKIVITTCIDQFLEIELAHYTQKTSEESMDMSGYDQHDTIQFSQEQIIEAIRKLSPESRMIYNLSVIEKICHNEIAGLLGISIDCSKTTLIKARKMLRNYLHISDDPITDLHNYQLIHSNDLSNSIKSSEKCFG